MAAAPAPAELEALLLPKDLLAFARLADERLGEIARLLDAGREPVERAERLVCRIYGLPAELEDEVVTHAIERAARREPGDDG